MAHFAEINEDSIVLRVLVTDNDFAAEGYDWLIENFGGTWIKTSYNGSIRKNFAGEGFTYDSERDAFIAPKPFESWILNEDTCKWAAPILQPDDEKFYTWDESTISWKEII